MTNLFNHVLISLCAVSVMSSCVQAQKPKETFELFANTKPGVKTNSKWPAGRGDYHVKFVSVNTKVPYQTALSHETRQAPELAGWTGERINSQLVFSSIKDVEKLEVIPGDLVLESEEGEISKEHVRIGYVYYVQADYTPGVCQKKATAQYTDMVVADIIDFENTLSFVRAYNNRPVWIQIDVPAGAVPGTYKGSLSIRVNGNEVLPEMNYEVKVLDKVMPRESDRKFRLDLWQYPLTAAEFYGVKPWSVEHFRLMEPAMRMLSDAGQSTITASFFWDVFNSTPRTAESMMIKVTKKTDGSWDYDFSNFDKWVTFMMDLGIDEQISVFGMAPLNYRYYYYDEAAGKVTYFSEGLDDEKYAKFWNAYLDEFEKHLKEKGWFRITALALDEKESDVLKAFLNFTRKVNKDWKVAFTGKYFPQLQENIYDYSVISNQNIPASTIVARREAGYKTTYYTSCWEILPNTFMVSQPIDATWLAWNAAGKGLDGYLRYAYNMWGKKVLNDTRNINYASGDNFLVYPGGRSSIRFEMLKDGIEDYEKIQLCLSESQRRTKHIIKDFKIQLIWNNPKLPRMKQITEAREALNSM